MLLKNWFKSLILSLVISVLGVLCIGYILRGIYSSIINDIESKERAHFERASYLLKSKVDSYIYGLQGLAGVYMATDFNPSSQVLKKYAQSRNDFDNFLGSMGFGFVRNVSHKDLSRFINEKQKKNPSFSFRFLEDSQRENHYIIEHIEPIERNKQAIGLDLASEPKRRAAAEASMLSGVPTMTAPIQLVQSYGNEVGFLFYNPIYSKYNLKNEDERTENFMGWSYTPFTVLGIVTYIKDAVGADLILDISDSNSNDIIKSNLVPDTRFQKKADWLTSELSIGGRTWIVKGAFLPNPSIPKIKLIFSVLFIILSGGLLLILKIAKDFINQKKNTELKNAELNKAIDEQGALMVASAKMAALGEMAAGIGHEINNPLAIISGKVMILNTMIDEKKGMDLEDIRDGLLKIDATAMRITRIIKGLKHISRDSSGDPLETTSLKNILNDTLELCDQKIRSGNIKLNVTGDLETTFSCRPVQITQVIMNLIGNSLDAIQDLPEKWIHIDVIANSENIEILVMDSGPGIPDEIVDSMMQPFFTTKDIGKGTGLGLSISHGIMAAHGGKLSYEKNKGNTCFKLSFKVN